MAATTTTSRDRAASWRRAPCSSNVPRRGPLENGRFRANADGTFAMNAPPAVMMPPGDPRRAQPPRGGRRGRDNAMRRSWRTNLPPPRAFFFADASDERPTRRAYDLKSTRRTKSALCACSRLDHTNRPRARRRPRGHLAMILAFRQPVIVPPTRPRLVRGTCVPAMASMRVRVDMAVQIRRVREANRVGRMPSTRAFGDVIGDGVSRRTRRHYANPIQGYLSLSPLERLLPNSTKSNRGSHWSWGMRTRCGQLTL